MPSNPTHPHFQNLRNLLRQEKEADHRAFLELVREKPLADRVAQGYTWYPLQVLNTGFALSEKAFVIVERTTHLNAPHQLRAGQPVSLFTQAAGVDQPTQQGVINFVERNRMKIILNARDVPDWINAGQLGVDMLFDDRSYHEMDRALEKVMAAKGDRLAELREILNPAQAPINAWKNVPQQPQGALATKGGQGMSHPPAETPIVSKDDSTTSTTSSGMLGLNDSQCAAVEAILHNPDVAIIHGPPGTGKTTTLVAAIKALAQTEHTVLVTAVNTVWVSDITYILTDEGWRYLTVILDLADRAVVSWILSQTMHAQCTVVPAFKQAIERRRVRPHSGLMFHSDRGVQYACEDFRTILAHYGIAQSMSRKGNCWDNAVAESFFKTIKTEELNRFKLIRATQLNSLIFKYIEGWYNTQRIHSTLRGLTPWEAFYEKTSRLAA